MNDIVNIDVNMGNSSEITEMVEGLLFEVRTESIPVEHSIKLPIAKLATLGAGVSSLIPAFNRIEHTMTFDINGTYQLANAVEGDVLKLAKDGNFWGAFKTAEGTSKFAKLKAASPVHVDDVLKLKTNPAMIMMAVAMYSVERELKRIEDMQTQIISFLEKDKEAEVEADLVTLNDIISKYKNGWDNEQFIASNHQQVRDIQRTARKNVIFYQKDISELINKQKKLVVVKGNVSADLKSLLNRFEYYRLSLFTFSYASFLDILLSGNFSEEYIKSSIKETQKYSEEYRNLFGESSVFLEKKSNRSIESNVLKGIGTTSNAVGKVMGSVPKIKDGQVDDFLRNKGDKIKNKASNISKDMVESFAKVSNPNTREFVGKMEDLIRIFNFTKNICFDHKNIYLITG